MSKFQLPIFQLTEREYEKMNIIKKTKGERKNYNDRDVKDSDTDMNLADDEDNEIVNNEEDVKRNWEQLKLKEGKKSVLEGVPKSLPALVKANRIQEKVAGVGFDWERPEQVFEKVKEELSELQEEVNAGNRDKLEAEFGDVLFSIVNYARFLDVNPENALERTNKKFIKRFQYLESKAKEQKRTLKDMSLAEMDVFWEEAKKI